MDIKISELKDIILKDQNNNEHNLLEYLGKWLILYFYPKDGTQGCTKEACNFRDNIKGLHELGVNVVGVSTDSVQSHYNFAQKHKLNFTILSDERKELAKKLNALNTKSIFGKKIEIARRITYLFNPQGDLVKVYSEVDPQTHASQLIEFLKSYNA